MAIYNEILAPRYARMIQKLFSMKGSPPTRQLSGEIMSMLPLFMGAENRYLESWDRFIVKYVVAAVAGQNAAARIRNPAGSNVIAVIEKLSVFGTLADSPSLQDGTTGADLTVGTSNTLDNRGRTAATCIVSSSGTGVNLSTGIGGCAFAANATYDFILDENQELVINPGVAFQLISGVVNQALNVELIWRERFLEESERA